MNEGNKCERPRRCMSEDRSEHLIALSNGGREGRKVKEVIKSFMSPEEALRLAS